MALYAVSPGGLAQAQDVNQLVTALKNVFFNVRSYGAVGNGSTDDTVAIQAAIDAAAAAGGGVVVVPTGSWKCNGIILKNGVTLTGLSGMFGYGPGAIRQSTLLNTTAGWCIDTPNSAIVACSVIGLNVSGPGSGTSSGGIRFRQVSWGKIAQVQVDNFANEGIKFESGSIACVAEDVLTTNVVLNRARGAPIGGVDIDGNDHILNRVEASTGAAGAGLSNPAFYIPAIMVRGASHFFTNCIGELSDVGFYVASDLCVMTQCRADHNYGHGFYMTGNAQFSICVAVNNSQETSNTYDGFYIHADSAQGNLLFGCKAASSSAKVHRYGLNDLAAYGNPTANTTVVGFNSRGQGTAILLQAGYMNAGKSGTPL